MKAVVLKHREWERIFRQVKQDYAHSPATYLVRSRMRDDLGWTWREHTHYPAHREEDLEYVIDDWRDNSSQIHIDFYSEEARTFFMLRYLNREQADG